MNDGDINNIAIQRQHLPALYQTATIGSGNAQKRLLLLTLINFLFLTIGACVSAINIHSIQHHDLIYVLLYSGTGFLALSIIVTLAMKIQQYEKKWYDGRAIAESIKTMSWRFMMNSEPYRSERDSYERFRRDLNDVLQSRRSFGELLGGDIAVDKQVTDIMKRIKQSDLATRKHVYLENRIFDQRKWYSKNSKKNRQSGEKCFWAIVVLQVVALLASILIISNPDISFKPIGVFTTLVAGLLGWSQLKQYRTLAESYGLAAQELGIIQIRLDSIKTDDEFAVFVVEAETAISREHTTWLARRVNA